jgi:regulator of Ty1 transposition protein 103
VLPTPVAHPVVPSTAPAPGNTSSQPAFQTSLSSEVNVPHDLLKSLQHARPGQEGGVYGQGAYEQAAKKRKMSRGGEDEWAAFQGDGDMDGIDGQLQELI